MLFVSPSVSTKTAFVSCTLEMSAPRMKGTSVPPPPPEVLVTPPAPPLVAVSLELLPAVAVAAPPAPVVLAFPPLVSFPPPVSFPLPPVDADVVAPSLVEPVAVEPTTPVPFAPAEVEAAPELVPLPLVLGEVVLLPAVEVEVGFSVAFGSLSEAQPASSAIARPAKTSACQRPATASYKLDDCMWRQA